MKPILFFLIRHAWEPQSLILLCSFSITASSQATRASGALSVGTGCLIRTKLCWHLILFVCLSSVFGSEPEQLTMSRWGVQQTWCHNRVTERYFKLALNDKKKQKQKMLSGLSGWGSVRPCIPALYQWPTKKQNPQVAVHHSAPGCRILPDQTWHLCLQELHSIISVCLCKYNSSFAWKHKLQEEQTWKYVAWAELVLLHLQAKIKNYQTCYLKYTYDPNSDFGTI